MGACRYGERSEQVRYKAENIQEKFDICQQPCTCLFICCGYVFVYHILKSRTIGVITPCCDDDDDDYIKTSEIPGEFSRGNIIYLHALKSRYLHM